MLRPATTMSGRPSSLTSPAATSCGFVPTAKVCCATNDTLVVTETGNYHVSGAPSLCPNFVQQLEASEDGSNSFGQHLVAIDNLVASLLESDSGKEIMADAQGVYGDSNREQPTAMSEPELTKSDLKKIGSGDLSPQKALEQMYGTSIINGARNWVVKAMSLNSDVDPLFQIKAIGDSVTTTAEFLIVAEMGIRAKIAVLDVTTTAVKSNAVGRVGNAITGLGDTASTALRGVQYFLEGVAMGATINLKLIASRLVTK